MVISNFAQILYFAPNILPKVAGTTRDTYSHAFSWVLNLTKLIWKVPREISFSMELETDSISVNFGGAKKQIQVSRFLNPMLVQAYNIPVILLWMIYLKFEICAEVFLFF